MTKVRSGCSKLLRKNTNGDQDDEATTSWEQWLLLRKLAWILLKQHFLGSQFVLREGIKKNGAQGFSQWTFPLLTGFSKTEANVAPPHYWHNK